MKSPQKSRPHMTADEIAKIGEMLLAGEIPSNIAKTLGRSQGAISYQMKRLGLPALKRGRKQSTPTLLPMVQEGLAKGMTQKEIGKQLGISHQRVSQILFPERHRARKHTDYLVRTGRIERARVCRICGEEKPLEKHHPDYRFDELIVWLCVECHGREHSGELWVAHRHSPHKPNGK